MRAGVTPSPQKRKRVSSAGEHERPARVRLQTDLPTRSVIYGEDEQQSPRTAVSKRMSTMALGQPRDSSPSTTRYASRPTQPYHAAEVSANTDWDDREHESNVVPWGAEDISAASDSLKHDLENGPISAAQLPMTPELQPVSSPILRQMISPLQTGVVISKPAKRSRIEPTDLTSSTESSYPSSPKKSHAKAKVNIDTKDIDQSPSQQRRKSPPPSTVITDLVWADAEITGHDPTDPDDDLYGINGVGFKPTREIAETRHIQRLRQISDWRKREENERRARRREARNHHIASEMSATAMNGDFEGAAKKVRFFETTE